MKNALTCLSVVLSLHLLATPSAAARSLRLLGGFGGSLDVFAGNVKRAPRIFIKLGLEWFYRLLCEPSRIGRMMKLPKFYFGTWLYKFRRKKENRA